jgi:hypothetical protein
MKNGQKLKIGDANVTLRNIQEVQASKLGDAPEAPLLHRQKSGHLSTYYIFITSYSMHFSWSIFTFAFSFLLFFCCNKWLDPQQISFEGDIPCFSLPRTLYFSLLSFNECSLFLELRLAFVFRLDFCSDLVLSLHQGVFRPLVYVGFIKIVVSKRFKWCWKRKQCFMQKSGTKRSLFRLRLRLFHAMLDVVLIVCLVVFVVA